MKATELRLGNLIFCKMPSIGKSNQEKAAVVDLLEDETIGVTGSNFSASSPNPKHFEGIPLTEEWLLKFGWQQVGHEVNFFKAFQGRYHFIFLHEGKWRYRMGYEDDGIVQIPIEYVHQFQNLFFALSGKELELKQSTPTT